MKPNQCDVPKVEIRNNECKGCYLCVAACPKKVLEASGCFNTQGYNYVKYKGEGCIGCAICFYSCPEPGAITVHKKGC